MTGLKKFLSNKNTVTIIGVLLAVAVLMVGYNMRVNQAISPVSYPCAKQKIPSGTKITDEMIELIDVPPAMTRGNVISERKDIIGKYAANDSSIPQGSLFYKESVVEENRLVDYSTQELKDGEVLFKYDSESGSRVSITSTYGNAVYPGNYVDVWVKYNVSKSDILDTNDAREARMSYERFLTNVKILQVLDSNGNNCFADMDNIKAPSQIIFALPEQYYQYMQRLQFLSQSSSEGNGYQVIINLVPIKKPTESDVKVKLVSTRIEEWVKTNTMDYESEG